MTGRELIIYILENKLEDEPVFKDGKFVGFVTVGEAASRMNVGDATIYVLINQELLNCIVVGDTVYIPANFEPPFKICNDQSANNI